MIDESSSEAELRLAEELIAEGLQYAESQLRGLPTRAMYLRDAVTELTAMRETFARTWRPVATGGVTCERGHFAAAGELNRDQRERSSARVVELDAFRTQRALHR
jgi:hypothetical protein